MTVNKASDWLIHHLGTVIAKIKHAEQKCEPGAKMCQNVILQCLAWYENRICK